MDWIWIGSDMIHILIRLILSDFNRIFWDMIHILIRRMTDFWIGIPLRLYLERKYKKLCCLFLKLLDHMKILQVEPIRAADKQIMQKVKNIILISYSFLIINYIC